jgi:hypothetical protein
MLMGRTPGRTPWSAADALVGLLSFEEAEFVTEERVQGDPRRPGGLPHDCTKIPPFGKLSSIGRFRLPTDFLRAEITLLRRGHSQLSF